MTSFYIKWETQFANKAIKQTTFDQRYCRELAGWAGISRVHQAINRLIDATRTCIDADSYENVKRAVLQKLGDSAFTLTAHIGFSKWQTIKAHPLYSTSLDLLSNTYGVVFSDMIPKVFTSDFGNCDVIEGITMRGDLRTFIAFYWAVLFWRNMQLKATTEINTLEQLINYWEFEFVASYKDVFENKIDLPAWDLVALNWGPYDYLCNRVRKPQLTSAAQQLLDAIAKGDFWI